LARDDSNHVDEDEFQHKLKHEKLN